MVATFLATSSHHDLRAPDSAGERAAASRASLLLMPALGNIEIARQLPTPISGGCCTTPAVSRSGPVRSPPHCSLLIPVENVPRKQRSSETPPTACTESY